MATIGLATAGLTLVTTTAGAAPSKASCNARANDTVKKLTACVTLQGVLEHEQAFQAIADANGDNRASGTTGYDDSLEYVRDRMRDAGRSEERRVGKECRCRWAPCL